MTLAAITNVVEILMKGTYPTTGSGAKNIFNVFHYRLATGVLDTKAHIIDTFRTNVFTPMATNCLSIDYTSTDSLVRFMDDVTDQYESEGASANGVIALPRLPGDLAVTVQLKSALRGKNFRGSKHFSPVPTSFVTKDELNAGGIAAWAAQRPKFYAVLTCANGSTLQPIVLSRSLSQLETNPTTIYGSDITGAVVNDTIGTMRRRKERTVI